jgi:hypothetical protein
VGVDTNLCLIDRRDYHEIAVPALQALLAGGKEPARSLFEKACSVLATQSREYPWGPLHGAQDQLEFGLSLIDGTAGNLQHPDPSITDPELIRRHHLSDTVCGAVIEGTCVPWDLPFHPRHCVTCDSAVWELYRASQRFEYVLTGEIYIRNRPAPFGIAEGDELLNHDLVQELFEEISSRVSPPGHPLSEREYFRNLYLLLDSARSGRFEVMASYC